MVLRLATLVSIVPMCLPGAQSEGFARFVPLLVIAGLLGALLLVPRRLASTLAPDALVITHLTGETRLPYAGMTAWQTAAPLGLKGGGTGLHGDSTGHYMFHADGLNGVLAASSATRGSVIVQASGKGNFLTPADPAGFLTDLARRGVKIGERSGLQRS